jgi:hypothetical protein
VATRAATAATAASTAASTAATSVATLHANRPESSTSGTYWHCRERSAY